MSVSAQGKPLHLFPPGRVVFLAELKTEVDGKKNDGESTWEAVWASPREIIREGILISQRMYTDHLCETVERALESAMHAPKGGEEVLEQVVVVGGDGGA